MRLRHLAGWTATVAFLVGSALYAQQTLRCGTPIGIAYVDGIATVTCPAPSTTPPPLVAPTIPALTADPSQITAGQASTLRWTLGGGAPASLTINPTVGGVPVGTTSRQVTPTATTFYTLTATNAAGAASKMVTVTVTAAPIPPTTGQIFGVVDETPDKNGVTVFGTCSRALHDTYTADGGDGYRYRTWHPAQDPSGCSWGHEHGDNPAMGIALLTDEANRLALPAVVKAAVARPVLFGYIGRRMLDAAGQPHEEAHEGFKVFIAARGDVNDDGFINRTTALHVTHMGTFRAARFSTRDHSVESRQIHESGVFQVTRVMQDSGDVDVVCDPRFDGLRKDVIATRQRCQINSAYEIWAMAREIRIAGKLVARVFSTPAAFDPNGAMNPDNRAELVYMDDPRVDGTFRFSTDRSGYRGCMRETYAQMPYYENAGGAIEMLTDAMGVGPASGPLALAQYLSAYAGVGPPSTQNPNAPAFKHKRSYCSPGLSRKN